MRILPGELLHFFLRPAQPRLAHGELRLRVGCGKIDHPGFVNIDALPRRNVHRVIFTRDYLGKLLLDAGFRRVYEWTPDDGGTGHDVNDWSRRPLMVNGRSYPVSLNLEAEQ